MNLHPETLQSHFQEHAANILLRAPRLSPSSNTSCKGPTSEAVCNVIGSDARWLLKQ